MIDERPAQSGDVVCQRVQSGAQLRLGEGLVRRDDTTSEEPQKRVALVVL